MDEKKILLVKNKATNEVTKMSLKRFKKKYPDAQIEKKRGWLEITDNGTWAELYGDGGWVESWTEHNDPWGDQYEG